MTGGYLFGLTGDLLPPNAMKCFPYMALQKLLTDGLAGRRTTGQALHFCKSGSPSPSPTNKDNEVEEFPYASPFFIPDICYMGEETQHQRLYAAS